MNKIKQYFKNLNISIDNNHKEKVREEILKFYSPAPKKIEIQSLIYKFSIATAAVIVFVTISFLAYLNFFHKNNTFFTSSTPKNKKIVYALDEDKSIENEKSEINKSEEKKDTIHKKNNETQKSHLKKEKTILIENSEEDKMYESDISSEKFKGEIEYAYIDQSTTTEDAEFRIYEEDKLINDKSNRKAASKKENGKTLNKETKNDETLSSIKSNEKEEISYINTDIYNQVKIKPNIDTDSFDYLNNQIITQNSIEPEKINEEEIINYFSLNTSNNKKEELMIEGSNEKNKKYFLMVYFLPGKDVNNIEVEITFSDNVYSYFTPGYLDKKETIDNIKPDSKIMQKFTNQEIIILSKIQIKQVDNKLGDVKINFIDTNNKKNVINKKILYNDIKDMAKTSLVFKNAVLGYMIAREAKGREYTIDNIIDFKNKYIEDERVNLSPDLNFFLENYIESKK